VLSANRESFVRSGTEFTRATRSIIDRRAEEYSFEEREKEREGERSRRDFYGIANKPWRREVSRCETKHGERGGNSSGGFSLSFNAAKQPLSTLRFVARLTSLFRVIHRPPKVRRVSISRQRGLLFSPRILTDWKCIWRAQNVPGRAGARRGMRVVLARGKCG